MEDVRIDISGAELVVKVLKSHGVNLIYNLCGSSTSSLIVQAHKAGIRIIDTRNEATGIYAAKACARLTGLPGVMVVTTGPGLSNTVTAALEAKFDEAPLIILSGGVPTINRGIGYVQDMDQVGFMRIPCKASMTITKKKQIVKVMKKAFYTACSDVPGPVYVELPLNVLVPSYKFEPMPFLRSSEASEVHDSTDSKPDLEPASIVSGEDVEDVEEADERKIDLTPTPITYAKVTVDEINTSVGLIASAKRPVLVIGSQAILRTSTVNELSAAVQAIGIPTFTVFASKGLMGKTHKYLLSQDVLMKQVLPQADMVILAGVECDYSTVLFGKDLPKKGAIISVNRDIRLASLNDGIYWKSTQVVGSDAGYYLIELSKALRARKYSSPPSWITTLRQNESDYEAKLQKKASQKSDLYLNPLAILRALETSQGNKNVLWVLDTGDFTHCANYFIKPSSPLSWIESGPYAGVGGGMGYAIGAKLANPGREVWCIVGDGSCGYTIMEFDTLNRHKINIVAIAGNDGQWGEICRHQAEEYGSHVSCKLLYTDYEKVVTALDGIGLRADGSSGPVLEDIMRKASDAGRTKSVFINALMGTTDLRKGYL